MSTYKCVVNQSSRAVPTSQEVIVAGSDIGLRDTGARWCINHCTVFEHGI